MMSRRINSKRTQLPIRMTKELRDALERDAAKSGWTVAEQVRYELMSIRGMWKKPYLPDQVAPGKS